jgi:hypothetical protein
MFWWISAGVGSRFGMIFMMLFAVLFFDTLRDIYYWCYELLASSWLAPYIFEQFLFH